MYRPSGFTQARSTSRKPTISAAPAAAIRTSRASAARTADTQTALRSAARSPRRLRSLVAPQPLDGEDEPVSRRVQGEHGEDENDVHSGHPAEVSGVATLLPARLAPREESPGRTVTGALSRGG